MYRLTGRRGAGPNDCLAACLTSCAALWLPLLKDDTCDNSKTHCILSHSAERYQMLNLQNYIKLVKSDARFSLFLFFCIQHSFSVTLTFTKETVMKPGTDKVFMLLDCFTLPNKFQL